MKVKKKVPERYLRKLRMLANLDQNNPLQVVGKFGEKSLKFGENNLKRLPRLPRPNAGLKSRKNAQIYIYIYFLNINK